MNTKSMDKQIGRLIRREREDKKLTLEELSELCSISVSYLGYVERGQRPASLTILKKLSLALRVPLPRFFAGAQDEGPPTKGPWALLLKLLPLLQKESPAIQHQIILYWQQNLKDIQKFFPTAPLKRSPKKR
jgi:transcriptional regulator with XRE-family HTH domain